MADSSTGGYLLPDMASPPLEDADLDAVLQGLVMGITALPGAMVRPRWQPVIPKQTAPSSNWCAIGITDVMPDANPYIEHDGVLGGVDHYQRHETLDVLASFYGPAGMRYAAQFRDGLTVPQNLEALQLLGMGYVNAQTIRAAPDLVNQQWIRRYDLSFTLRRQVIRTYAVRNIASADIRLNTDAPLQTLNITVEQ